MKNMKKVLSFLLVLVMVVGSFAPMAFADGTSTEATKTEAKAVATVSNTIDIVSFNDFHGALAEDVKEGGKNVGMAKLVATTKEYLGLNANTIFVSGGDNYQGTAMSNLTLGAPVNAMMKGMGLVASAVGNHEFDWGTKHMENWQKDGGFTFVAANIIDTKTNDIVSWAKPYVMVEKNGKKIALLGFATKETIVLTKGEFTKGLEFKNPAEVAKTWVEYLQSGKAPEGKPDAIVALTHLPSYQDKETKAITGEEITELAAVKGIDGIISGHSHRTVSGKIGEMPVVQANYNGRALAKLSLEFDTAGKLKAVTPSVEEVFKRKNDMIADEAMKKTYDEYAVKLKPVMDEVIGKAAGTYTHNTEEDQTTQLGEFVCKLMAEKAGVDIAIQNGGGLRRDLPEGDITMGLMYEIMPFDNALTVIELTGEDLIKNIENGLGQPDARDGSFSGLYVEYDMEKPFMSRITKITTLDGKAIDKAKYYKVVSNDFLVDTKGADGYDFSNGKNKVYLGVPIREAMVDYIKEAKVITPGKVDYEVNVTGKKPETKPEVKPQPKPETKPQVTTKVYVVKSGDVLWKIAEKFGITYQELAKMNNLKNVHLIQVGQELVVPAK